MLAAVGIYTGSVSLGARPVASIVVVGVLVLVAAFLVSWHLPPGPTTDRS
jgi:LPLT family lysophospholipid transporter-like MFS transporter